MEKPKLKNKTISYFEYRECRDFLQEKYGYDERDYAGKFKGGKMNDAPYLDFWHWVLENYDIHNGCYITFCKEKLEEIDKDWVREIYSRYIEEFADENGEIYFYVWW